MRDLARPTPGAASPRPRRRRSRGVGHPPFAATVPSGSSPSVSYRSNAARATAAPRRRSPRRARRRARCRRSSRARTRPRPRRPRRAARRHGRRPPPRRRRRPPRSGCGAGSRPPCAGAAAARRAARDDRRPADRRRARAQGVLARHDDETCRLPAAEVAAGRLRRVERGEQALRERPACGRERLGHRRPDLVRAQHVALDAEPGTLEVAAVGDAARTGVRGRPSSAIDEGDLPHVPQLVLREERVERLARRLPALHRRKPALAVPALGERLRRDGTDPGSAHAHAAPVLNARDCTATPSSLLSVSHATSEYVMRPR